MSRSSTRLRKIPRPGEIRSGKYVGPVDGLWGHGAILMNHCPGDGRVRRNVVWAQFNNMAVRRFKGGPLLGFGWHRFKISEWRLEPRFSGLSSSHLRKILYKPESD